MHAFDFLKADHDRVSQMFDELEQAEDFDERFRVFQEIRQELELHAQIEEKLFYPLFQDREGFEELIEDAYDEHQEVREILEELDDVQDEDELDDKLGELIECVEHHVDEEENKLFTMIEKIMSREELEKVGRELEEEKKKFTQTEAA